MNPLRYWLLLALVLLASSSLAHRFGTNFSSNQRLARVTVAHLGTQPSRILVQLEPSQAAGKGELVVSLTQGSTHYRQVLLPLGPGRYALSYTFPNEGRWNIYLRYGPGQAGYVGSEHVEIRSGSGLAQELDIKLYSGYNGNVPAYVQPLGFVVFGLLATTALLSVVWLLRWIGRQTVRVA